MSVPEVAVLDDSLFILEAWQLLMNDATVHIYEGPKDFWAALAKDAGLLSRLSCVITDYHFAPGEPEDGVTFAKRLRALRKDLKIMLSTELAVAPAGSAGIIDVTIDKDPRPYAELKPLFK